MPHLARVHLYNLFDLIILMACAKIFHGTIQQLITTRFDKHYARFNRFIRILLRLTPLVNITAQFAVFSCQRILVLESVKVSVSKGMILAVEG